MSELLEHLTPVLPVELEPDELGIDAPPSVLIAALESLEREDAERARALREELGSLALRTHDLALELLAEPAYRPNHVSVPTSINIPKIVDPALLHKMALQRKVARLEIIRDPADESTSFITRRKPAILYL